MEADDAAGDLAGDGGGGLEGHGEDDDNEERKEEHAGEGVAGTPLQAEIFLEVEEEVVEVGHACVRVRSATVAWAARR